MPLKGTEMKTMLSHEEKKALRKRAEAIAAAQLDNLKRLSPSDIRSAVQELQVHQIELELQNEELRRTQNALEEAKNRYFRLFHNAPIGYVVLDANGLIRQANAAFSDMARIDPGALIGKSMADFLHPDDGRMFLSRFKAFAKIPSGKHMVARLKDGSGKPMFTLLQAVAAQENRPVDENELLLTVTNITLQKQAEFRLQDALAKARRREEEFRALLMAARAVLDQSDFPTTVRSIFHICRELIGATAGYIALRSEEGTENEWLLLPSGYPLDELPTELPMIVVELREEALSKRKAVYINRFTDGQRIGFPSGDHLSLENFLFSPLVLREKVLGVIGFANKPAGFDDNDVNMAEGFGELAAVALLNSRNVEARNRSQRQKEKVIEELKAALSEVKTLSGLLPICSHCKKIRDDSGYWRQLEVYIQEHSGAVFSHSICRDCAKRFYPDIRIYED